MSESKDDKTKTPIVGQNVKAPKGLTDGKSYKVINGELVPITYNRKPREPKEVTFPTDGKMNAYGFIHISTDVGFTLGWERPPKGVKEGLPLTLDRDGDALVIRVK